MSTETQPFVSDYDLSYPLDPSPEALHTSKSYAIQAVQNIINEAGKSIISAGSLFPVSDRSKRANAIAEEPIYNIKIYREMYVKVDLLHEIVNLLAVFLFQGGMKIKPPSHLREMDDFDIKKVKGLKENIIFIQRWSRYIGLSSIGIEIVKSMLWAGNAYVEIVFDENSAWRVSHLKIIPPDEMRVVRDDFGEILGYLQFPYKSGLLSNYSQNKADRTLKKFPNDAVWFEPDEIAHLKWDALPGNAYGVSLFESIKDIIAIVIGMREDMGIIVRNHAAPTVLFRVGTDMIPASEATITDFANYLTNNFDNTTNLVSSTMVQEPNVIDTSSKVIDLPNYLQTALNILFAGVGIPEILLGQGNETTEATAKQQVQSFEKKLKTLQQTFKDAFELKVLSRLCKQVKVINERVILLPEHMDVIPEFYFPPVESTEEKRLRLENGVKNGSVSHEEYRKEYGHNPKFTGTSVIAEDREFQMKLTKVNKPAITPTTGKGTKKDGKTTQKPKDRDNGKG